VKQSRQDRFRFSLPYHLEQSEHTIRCKGTNLIEIHSMVRNCHHTNVLLPLGPGFQADLAAQIPKNVEIAPFTCDASDKGFRPPALTKLHFMFECYRPQQPAINHGKINWQLGRLKVDPHGRVSTQALHQKSPALNPLEARRR
jgi:hypothetical protein